ncbi:DUF4351 domain-containing protein [Calothrix sp. NIES-2098]|uniref:DUF4351 domain-containing protein n=1 Tax=Calothrix sp. NIES-2098 TaxID=1954171 RepID=UPI00404039B5
MYLVFSQIKYESYKSNHDGLFKELLTTFFWEFIELFFPEITVYLERDSISLTQLKDLAEVLLNFSSEADLVAWLQQSQ